MTIARYTFLPWLRRGIANRIETPAGAGASRATLSVTLTAKSDAGEAPLPPVTVRLVGPGDIASMISDQIIRVEPSAGCADFEPNYLAAIEFYDEDFAWRYSPFPVDGGTHRLTPWLVLAVLKDVEFRRISRPGQTLQALELTASAKRADLFPPVGEEWAWAHVHLNEYLAGSGTAPDLGALATALDANPDLGYCRLICPRRLDPNTTYSAFLLPALEVGRKAGLGESVGDSENGATRSWESPAALFPIYYEWKFRTGVNGDFESLVRALVPRDIDPRVGVREMDVAHPGFGVPNVANPPDGLVKLEGALLAPTTERKGLAPTSDFVALIEPRLNAPAEARVAGEPDPLVEPPIYGCWHAAVERVDASGARWVNQLNLDPRERAAAGLGARVVRANQERYMRLAWEQIGDVLTVNYKIRRMQLSIEASAFAQARTVSVLPDHRATLLVAPVFAKVLGSPTTLRALVVASRVPRAALSPALRKQMRPRGPLARRLLPGIERKGAATLLAAINEGKVSAAPPRGPAGGATLEGVTASLDPSLAERIRRWRWLILLLLLLLVLALFALSTLVGVIAAVLAVSAVVAAWRILFAPAAEGVAGLLSPTGLSAASIADVPPQPDFAYAGAVEATIPAASLPPPKPPIVHGDSPAADDIRRALTDFHDLLGLRVPPPEPRPALDLGLVREKALAAMDPRRAIAGRFTPLLRVGEFNARSYARTHYTGGRGGGELETPREIMAYPDIKLPMYAPLAALSEEYFVPGLNLVPNNTISLMKTNQEFIESYLVGLNHEFSRELLWRGYPTDQQGSYFRQFWDVTNYVDLLKRDAKELAEALKDIPRLHQWQRASALGSHNKRDAEGDSSQIVLVIRGDLLKRYPNIDIYAQRAQWGMGARANRLVLPDESGQLFASQPRDPRLRFQLYRAFAPPDIYFIGFDLTVEQARGDPRLQETAQARAILGEEDLGWFFVLQEKVGEPRFGMDVDAPIEPQANKWENLAWVNLDLSGGQAVNLSKAFQSSPAGNDGGVKWNSNAADMASILYQEPAMVAVHGREMLKNLQNGGS